MQQPQVQMVESADRPVSSPARAAFHAITPEYFRLLNIPVIAGRTFTGADRVGSESVAVVSETLARALWPAGNGLGRRVSVPQNQERGEPVPVTRLVVGIVRDVRQGANDRETADVYVPHLQTPGRFAFLLVRTAAAPAGWIAPVAAAFRDIDPEIAVNRPRPLAAIVEEGRAGARFMSSFLALVASAAALLALVGLYGVIAYAVRQREREIAVRMAVGADPGRITRLFVRQGAFVLLTGIALGTWGAVAIGRLLESQLVGVTPRDPLALTAAAAAFGCAGLLAIWWPSRRAAAMDPAVALRTE
jgi:putative ABC transport system permease protein